MNNKGKEYKDKPILRFLARYIDSVIYMAIYLILFSVIYFVVFNFLGVDKRFLDYAAIPFIVTILVFFILIETVVLTTFQTTAGKKFLNISIEKKDGSEIKFKDALKRTVLVWIRGLALVIPIVSFIVKRIIKDSNFEVIHHNVPKWRIVIAFVIFIVTIAYKPLMVFISL